MLNELSFISHTCTISAVVGAMKDAQMSFSMVFHMLESLGKINSYPELVDSFERLEKYQTVNKRYDCYSYYYYIQKFSLVIAHFIILNSTFLVRI